MSSEEKVPENESSKKAEGDKSENDAFEELLSHVGTGGTWQWTLFLILSVSGVFGGFNNYGAVFLAAAPDFICVPPSEANESYWNNTDLTFESVSNFSSHPLTSACEYNVTINDGHIPNVTIVSLDAEEGERRRGQEVYSEVKTKTCTNFYFDHSVFQSTVVTEWNLVCDRRWLMTLTQTTYMLGMLVGGFLFSELSDIFGRRRTSLTAMVSMIVSSLGAAFAPNYATFIFLRFLVAGTSKGMFLTNFVIQMEIAGQRSRGTLGLYFQVLFAIGSCILAVMAYFATNWRTLALAMSVPSLFLLLYFWVLPESPRWLFHNGREEEALKILKRGARINKKKLPEDAELKSLVANITRETHEKKSMSQNFRAFIENEVTLVRTPVMRRRCLVVFFGWFVVAMIYYGLVFNGSNLDLSENLTLLLAGALEAIAMPLTALAFKRFGRRLPLIATFITCGVACMLILAVPKDLDWLNLTLVCIGRFCASAAFAIVYVYSAELVPTGVRNSAVGTSNVCSRVGSSIAPIIVDGLGTVHYTIPSTVFGVLSITAGLLVFLLPETGKMKLPSTVEEVEALEK